MSAGDPFSLEADARIEDLCEDYGYIMEAAKDGRPALISGRKILLSRVEVFSITSNIYRIEAEGTEVL